MWRKNDAHTQDDVEGVAQRLRTERPEAGPLELDRIKTSAMSRVKATAGRRVGTRRLAVAGLTAGLLVATTGGVLAGQGGPSAGNAAIAQYGNNCDVNNGNGNNNGGKNGNGNGDSNNGNNDGNNNDNCNENSFNETNITNISETVNNTTNNTTNGGTTNITYTTISATPAGTPLAGVLGSKSTKALTSKRHIKIHVNVPRGARLSRVTVKVDGKRVKTLKGKAASANVELVNLPCSTGATTIEISVTLSNGKTVTARHSYHLCS